MRQIFGRLFRRSNGRMPPAQPRHVGRSINRPPNRPRPAPARATRANASRANASRATRANASRANASRANASRANTRRNTRRNGRLPRVLPLLQGPGPIGGFGGRPWYAGPPRVVIKSHTGQAPLNPLRNIIAARLPTTYVSPTVSGFKTRNQLESWARSRSQWRSAEAALHDANVMKLSLNQTRDLVFKYERGKITKPQVASARHNTGSFTFDTPKPVAFNRWPPGYRPVGRP